MSRLTIHNPDNDAHFMRVRPVNARVTVRCGETLLADTANALRVLETGHDVYDPVLYIPEVDIRAALEQVAGKSTHCPLKGDCSYYALDGEEIAWSYDRPLARSEILKGYLAFYPGKVAITEAGSGSDAGV